MEMKNIHTNNDDGMNDSSCCTPFVSAPSSPGRTGSFFYSAPASPMHFLLSSDNSVLTTPQPCAPAAGNEFDFDANSFPMSSADELFFNGQIRPMKQNKQLHLDGVQEEVSDDHLRGRLELRNRSLRRVRSEEQFQHVNDDDNDNDNDNDNDKLSGQKKSTDEVEEGRPWLLRNSKRWVSLFLYRSKSEGRNNGRHKYFWSSFSPVLLKGKKTDYTSTNNNNKQDVVKEETTKNAKNTSRKSNESCSNSQRLGLSAHYKANRAQSEEMRKKTYLPYRQGIFGCIGLNPTPGPPASFNAFAARAFNSVSS